MLPKFKKRKVRKLESEARESREYTVDDIYALPEGERAELIDGKIYFMSSPSAAHQRVLGKLYRIIADYIDSKKSNCEVFLAPFAVFLNNDNKNYVEPDIFVVCDKYKLDEKGCNGAPDWVIEIVSPSSRSMDYFTKLFKYRESGVREYWTVDPQSKMIKVYNFEKGEYAEYSFAEKAVSGIYEDLTVLLEF